MCLYRQVIPLFSHQFPYYKLRCILKEKFLGGWGRGSTVLIQCTLSPIRNNNIYTARNLMACLHTHTAQSKITCQEKSHYQPSFYITSAYALANKLMCHWRMSTCDLNFLRNTNMRLISCSLAFWVKKLYRITSHMSVKGKILQPHHLLCGRFTIQVLQIGEKLSSTQQTTARLEMV